MFFLSMALELTCQKCPPIGLLQLSIFAHAAVMNLISSVDNALGRRLHDCMRNKPLSLAVVSNQSSRLTLRVSFMGQRGLEAADVLAMALTQTDCLQLGNHRWHVSAIHCSGHTWAATSTWADLTEPCSASWLEFNFVTPTGFKKSDGIGNQFVNVLPQPLDVFRSLLDRWNSLDGPVMPPSLASYIQGGGCMVSDFNIRCVTTRLRQQTPKGFIGTVTYELSDRDPVCVSAMHQLGRLAFFSGVGCQTARGMGAVRTHSW